MYKLIAKDESQDDVDGFSLSSSAARTASTQVTAFAHATMARPVLIAIPLFRRPDLAKSVVRSLLDCSEEIREIRGEVLLIDDSPEDSSLLAELNNLMEQIGDSFACKIKQNSQNEGFVRSCNRAIDEAIERKRDLLLLNSDTIVTQGALIEMARVSRLDPMTGFVNPRSNNATLATIPYQDRYRHLGAVEARAAWFSIKDRLPIQSYVPTAVGFCMWIRWNVLAEFGRFDEIYGAGYHEENDLVMRAGRRGYRAVLANHAFVWHEGRGSFQMKSAALELEKKNNQRLISRYPEYEGLVNTYFGSPEQRAEHLLGTLILDEKGRLDVALDFSSFPVLHNGTTAAGFQLLAAAVEQWSDRFNLYVLCSQEIYDFHNYAEFGVPRREPYGPEVFAAIYRVGQPFDWGAVERLVLKGATISVAMLDTISMDCSQLYSPRLHCIWDFVIQNVDMIVAVSDFSLAQLQRRFTIRPEVLRLRSLHSLDIHDYALPKGPPSSDRNPSGYLFVIGNHFWHKEVLATVRALAKDNPARSIVVLAGEPKSDLPADNGIHAPGGIEPMPNIKWLQTGALSPQDVGLLYENATAVVFPSHYEGFGMPLLNALAAQRPIYVRPLPVFEQIVGALGGESNVHVFNTTAELVQSLRSPQKWCAEGAAPRCFGDAIRAADEIGSGLDRMIASASYERIVRRIRAIQTLDDFANIRSSVPRASDRPTLVARHFSQIFEDFARRALALPGIYAPARCLYRVFFSFFKTLRWLSGGTTPLRRKANIS
jgi:GT2 family glycosyltransferase